MPYKLSFFCLLLFSAPSFAQNTTSSPYSVFGLGTLNERTTALNRSLGGTGIAFQDPYNLNTANPASYISIASPVNHLFEIGIYLESNQYSTTKLSESKTSGGLSNLSYWFKAKPWWAVAVGLSPFSSVSYSIETNKQVALSTDINYLYSGSGNTTQLYFGNSFRLTKNFSAGFNIAYLFGSITRSESMSGTSYTQALTLNDKVFTNKVTLDYGVQYKIPMGAKTFLAIGVTYDNSVTLKGRSEFMLLNSNSDTLDTRSGNDITYDLPASVGAGISLKTGRSMLGADLKFKEWSEAEFSNLNVAFQDTWRFSTGYSYLGNGNALNYAGLITFQTGFYMQNHYMKLKGNNIRNYGFSFGAGFPTLDGRSTINLTYSFDRFGTLEDGLIQQNSQRVMLNIIIRDVWGIKRKFD